MTVIGPGSRVKCINGAPWIECRSWWQLWKSKWFDSIGPARDTIWTVVSINNSDDPEDDEKTYLTLKEWPDPDANFSASSFTPLDDDSVDLSALTAALNKGPLEPERDERVRVVERVR